MIKTIHFSLYINDSKKPYLLISSNLILSEIGLIICLLLGILISIASNKVFLVWLGLELKMFGVIPFLSSRPSQTKKTLLLASREIKVSFYYFFVQVVGSLLFRWGFVLGDCITISIIGLLIKLGAAPFFWWVPSLFSRLDWIRIGLLGTIQKIPGLLLLRVIVDLKIHTCIFLSISGLLIACIGIKFSHNNLKQLIAWSSIKNMRILIVLIVTSKRFGLLYYIFYRVLSLSFCFLLSEKDNSVLCNSFIKGERYKKKRLVSILLLVFSGLPPMIRFVLKIYFLGGLYTNDMGILAVKYWTKVYLFLFLHLMGWILQRFKWVIIFLVLITIQSIGYIKAFIKINSTGSSRLSFMSKSKYKIFKRIYWVRISIYIFRLFLIWI